MATTPNNPLGLDGFAFCEFTTPEPDMLARQFDMMGFVPTHRHRPRRSPATSRGASPCSSTPRPKVRPPSSATARPLGQRHGFYVADPAEAFDHAVKGGAVPVDAARGCLSPDARAIEGIGGSYLYLVKAGDDLFADWTEVAGWQQAEVENNVGLDLLDHLTHNVRRGEMRTWSASIPSCSASRNRSISTSRARRPGCSAKR
jgi:4-hydroxyphenylpyruvate dioxygenase